MKIERVRSQIVRLPADEPLADGKTIPGATRDIVVVKLATKDGIEGLGVTFFGAALTGALKAAAARSAHCPGRRSARDRAHRRQAAARRQALGPSGIFTLALSAIDTALGTSVARRWGCRSPSCSAAIATASPPTPAAP